MAVKSKDKLRELYYPKRAKDDQWVVQGQTLPTNLLSALLYGFRWARKAEEKEYLFWEIADLIWNQDPENKLFEKHRWAWRMCRHACREKYLAVGGAASAGKSYFFAGWAIVNWLCDPSNTSVLITSTHLKGARDRIWGSVMKLIKYVPDPPCKIRDAVGTIVYYDGLLPNDQAGLKLVAADKSQSKDKIGKMIGIKAARVILIADELGEISENVLTAATGNLAANPYFQMIGMSNPASRFDPFGVFAEPKNGWESVNTDTDIEWRTRLNGLYIRLDSEDSPNFDSEPNEDYEIGYFPYLPTPERIDEALDALGATREEARKSRNFMRFHRAVFFDSDDDETVYSEAEILRAGATARRVLTKRKTLAGCDPSFSSGGDKTVLTFIEIGFDEDQQYCVMFREMVYIYEDMTDRETPRNLQIAQKVKDECVKRGLKPEDLAVDASGAGGPFCDILQTIWETGFLRVQFGGAASDRPIRNDGTVTAKERYRNKASELFFIGKQYLIGRQMYNLPPVLVKQMCLRISLEPKKGPKGLILQVEPKAKFKARLGYSPDETDSYLVAVELARHRHSFIPSDPVVKEQRENPYAGRFRRNLRSYDPTRLGFQPQLA